MSRPSGAVALGSAERDIAALIAEWDLARAAIAVAAVHDCFTHPEIGRISPLTHLDHMIAEDARRTRLGHAEARPA